MKTPIYEKRIAQWIVRFLRGLKGKAPAVRWVVIGASSYAETECYYKGKLYTLRVAPMLMSRVSCQAIHNGFSLLSTWNAELSPKTVANLFALEIAKRHAIPP